MTARACRRSAKMGTASIGPAAHVIDLLRLQPILMTVARDRAADRGCTEPRWRRGRGPARRNPRRVFILGFAGTGLRRRGLLQTPRLPEVARQFPAIARDRVTTSRRAFPYFLPATPRKSALPLSPLGSCLHARLRPSLGSCFGPGRGAFRPALVAFAAARRDDVEEIIAAIVIGDLVARFYVLDGAQEDLVADRAGLGVLGGTNDWRSGPDSSGSFRRSSTGC